jgi:hypothetical protein
MASGSSVEVECIHQIEENILLHPHRRHTPSHLISCLTLPQGRGDATLSAAGGSNALQEVIANCHPKLEEEDVENATWHANWRCFKLVLISKFVCTHSRYGWCAQWVQDLY